jgi:hypothetical protein
VTGEIPAGGVTAVRVGVAATFTVDGVNDAINELPGKMFAPLGVAQIANRAGVDAGTANGSELIPWDPKLETAVNVVLVGCIEMPAGNVPI